MAEAAAPSRSGRGLTLTQLAWLIPLTAVLVALRRPTQDNSYLWHIEAGIRQIDLGSVLTADPFTFTAGGQPWRTQSWLVELLYGWMEGIRPLLSAPVVVGTSAIILMLAVGMRVAKGRGILGPAATVWVMWLVLGYFTARPVFPSLAFFGVLVLVADTKRLRWTLPLLFWIWASIHGGFFMGLGYLVLRVVRERDKSQLLDVGFGVLASSLTAHGWGAWETLFTFASSSDNLDLIAEWLPPDFLSIAHIPFLLALVAVIWLGAAGKLGTRDLWILLPFVVFAFTANRSVPLAAIAIAPIVFPTGTWKFGRTPFSLPLSTAVLALIVALPLVLPIEEGLFEQRFPVAATEAMREVRTFHDDNSGGYLIYRRFPFVLVDDRAELFGALYGEVGQARAARPGWQSVLEEHDLKQALLRVDEPLRTVLELSGWESKFEDDDFIVLSSPTR